MAYSKKVIDRFEQVTNNPAAHGVGKFDPKDPTVATGMTGAPACGDVMKLDLKLDPETDTIIDVKFKTYGCGSAIASSSMFVEMLTGLTIEEAKQIKDKEIAEALELPPIKIHCSVLAEDSIKRAIQDWEEKKAGRTTSWIDEMQKKDDKSMIGHNSNNVETYPENGM
jgi:nitrogen fixation NifU-like protein